MNHPAPFPAYMIDRLAMYVRAEHRRIGRRVRIIDPFAGVGRVHDLPQTVCETVGVEIEPEWSNQRAGTIVGDATQLPADWTATFDAVVTSPVYANRASDHHEAKDSCKACDGTGINNTPEGCADAPFLCPDCHDVACKCGGMRLAMKHHNASCPVCRKRTCKPCSGSGLSKRYTYRHALGRMPTEGSASVLQWVGADGEKYRRLHKLAWREAHRVLRPDGLCLVNVKNHIRDGQEQLVVEWHAQALQGAGFKVMTVDAVPAPGMRHGANRGLRVDAEQIIVGRRRDLT